MDSAHGATPHQLAADPATGRATVYIETSRVGWRGVDTCQRLGAHTLAGHDPRVGDVSVIPASGSTGNL
jgi:hypothetical protein